MEKITNWINEIGSDGQFGIILGAIICYVVTAILLGRIFKKAEEAEWKAWLPIVNFWVLFKLGGREGWNSLWIPVASAIAGYGSTLVDSEGYMGWPGVVVTAVACLMALVGLIMTISVLLNVQKKLGKSAWFIILYIIMLIAPLWMWILALDKSKYNNRVGRPRLR